MSEAVYEACAHCGLAQRIPELRVDEEATCVRCEFRLVDPRTRSNDLTPTFAIALAALILFPAAITLPIMALDRFGEHTEASIWTGSIGLLTGGHLFLGIVVFGSSVVLPFLKLVSLLLISGLGERIAHSHRVKTWHVVELAGRFGMLDVLVIAILVAWLKLGDYVEVTPGSGAIAFVVCVLLSLVSSALFDPRAVYAGVPVPGDSSGSSGAPDDGAHPSPSSDRGADGAAPA